MSLATARQAIVDTLTLIPGLSAYGFPQQNANLPMAHVLLDSIDADYVLNDDAQRFTFVVRLFVGPADIEDSVLTLDPFIDPSGATSVRGVIDTDPTLDSQVDSCRVVQVRNFGGYLIGGIQLLGVEIVLDVIG